MNAWWWDALAGALTGVLSGFGLGGGTLLMVYMTLPGKLEQHAAQSVNLLYFLPCAGASLISHIREKKVEFKAAIPAIGGGLITGALGAFISLQLDASWLRRAFGIGMLALGLRETFGKGARQPPER